MKTKSYIAHIVLITCILLAIYPIIFAVSNSLKKLSYAYDSMLNLIPIPFTMENFDKLVNDIPLLQITTNTFVIASVITIVKVAISFLAAFAIVFYQFKFKKVTYIVLVATIFVPFTVTMVPNYIIMARLGFVDSVWGVILPQLADAIGIFMLTQSMRNIPRALLDSLQVDNISVWHTMKDVIVPITKPALTSTSIWFFILSWNEYIWPNLMLKNEENYTLPLALQLFVSSEGGTNFTVAMALSVLTMAIPLIIYLVFQRFIIDTFTTSGIK
ncbi:MAG: carbohydrate ABC transporter permease [Staphylococcus equorum]|uniref:Carbohydrate ABC transporter permease n=1 Tax=Staphylococcus equorum TaxID=246432 RepID=A0AAW7ABT0_9STAP|nr:MULTISPECIES: carbohydrate ABC transporter permease [Staphylococcus]EJX18979.1 SN-glycerol-3-phosphate ABC superfamily ATP binding cassette transporter, membrane protein [Staphylococcus sp. OJ82]MDK9844037.1 carbohydrate ABC transporter permease [Staphylococcus equorum]MDK9864496.1 carbohydrate ABC transporter permease [Staphylococcus equorum]MDN6067558.1 carbohydrate ABC transporter permease [Staphylococcus equorum]